MSARYFESSETARRYAKGRPYLHPSVMERVREVIGLEGLLANGLDVGCGTGMSTVALRLLARRVLGIDVSAVMVEIAPRQEGIDYAVASAEKLPVATGSQDVVALSSVRSYIDSDDFFAESRRALRPGGLLVEYGHDLGPTSGEDNGFRFWQRCDGFESKFPRTPGGDVNWRDRRGFETVLEEDAFEYLSLDASGIADYMVTHGNVTSAVESGKTTYDEAHAWLLNVARSFFGETENNFIFHGETRILRRI